MDNPGDTTTTRPIYTCVRCNTIVPPNNDLHEVMEEWRDIKFGIKPHTGGEPFFSHRHFLPVNHDGKRICNGSMSNAQYVEGQPRDDRGDQEDGETESDYNKNAQPMREAYRRVLKKFDTN